MAYCNLGLVVSGVGGVAFILILAASFKEGLKVDVTLTSLFLMVVSCAIPVYPARDANIIKMEDFIYCLLNTVSKFCFIISYACRINYSLCYSSPLLQLPYSAYPVPRISIQRSMNYPPHSGKWLWH